MCVCQPWWLTNNTEDSLFNVAVFRPILLKLHMKTTGQMAGLYLINLNYKMSILLIPWIVSSNLVSSEKQKTYAS